MALIQCPDCKEQLSDSAPACPKCGRPMPDAKPPKKKIGWKHYAILAVAVLAIASLLRSRLPSDASPGANATQAMAERKMDKAKEKLQKRLEKQMTSTGKSGLDADCTPPQLYREYNANEVAADAKYKGKWIRVQGRVQSVAKDFTNAPYLNYDVDGYGVAHVRANLFDVQVKDGTGANDFTTCTVAEKVAAFKPGQKVVVECLGKGMILSMPVLEQCLVVDELTK